ncbi:two-component system OmpR family sensor kinase [Paucimonas lemoignei]|uniref:histidine kinase n=1 Tax=Paucimonas lemoignei TaxID=29443 RepID=A0A4R3HYT5_PAULE|nr:ATP-binding protein [Paucimonas lemoignei]TCS38034.1 two-component system OmpR family sensor kinase [Paucimonas lemoignei]
MGRLFWKFFFAIWVAQLFGTMSVMFIIEVVHRQHEVAGPEFVAPNSPQHDIPRLPPRGPKLLPIEPLVAHLVASLIVAAILAHYLSKPIRSLRAAIGAMASGQLQVAAADAVERRKDELADLLREFDHMAGRVASLVDGQRQLFHDVSHELRSPLARMQVAIGLARQQPEKTEQLLERIDGEIIRTDRLIGELLALSRLTMPEMKMADEEFGIDELLTEIVENARFEGKAKGQKIRSSIATGASINGSPELMGRAIENVVRNAIEHTPRDSTISVEARMEPGRDRLTIAVSDTGPGVPDIEIDHHVNSSFRGIRSSRSAEGHGLGLSISKRIIDAHQGDIHFRNLDKGGLCVVIVLPISQSRQNFANAPDGELAQMPAN